MAQKKTAKKPARKSAKARTSSGGFTADERAAMKERAKELKAERSGSHADLEPAVLAKIAAMPEPDRSLGKKLHAIVRASAPSLTPRLWYGMPAYAKDGKVLCYFQNASKFKVRYATFGFSDVANLDQGDAWPVVFAVKKLTPAEEKKIAALVKKAVR